MHTESEIKCATFNPALQAAIPPHIRAKMDADRAAAEARQDRTVWLAEAPTIPGYYLRREPRPLGKLGEQKELGTRDAYEARHFTTRLACAAYCEDHPEPRWIPVQHVLCANSD